MKININPGGKDKSQDLEHLYQNYTPARGKINYNNLYDKNAKDNKWIIQLLVSGAVFLVLFGLFKLDIPFTGALKNGVKYVLTSEANFRPVLNQIVRLAAQTGNLELPVIDDLPAPAKTALSELPQGSALLLPVSGKVIRTYGWLVDPKENIQGFHEGVDIAVPVGTSVKAASDGRVIAIDEKSSLGKYVLVQTTSGGMVRYANLSEVLVQGEQQVKAGDVIAKTGMKSDPEPHLHFEVIVDGKPVDPLTRLGIDFTKTGSADISDAR